MGEWGIRNYQPQWTNSATDLVQSMQQISTANMQIRSIWSLWDEEEDEWFNDAPIVICTQEQQLEFCATQLDLFSCSIDTIDLTLPVYWCDEEDPDVLPFKWVQQRNVEFADLVGKKIVEIVIIESGIDRDLQSVLTLGGGILSGIALKFDRDRLEITNGLDCNSLTRIPLD
jgi:hypothetical protein